MDTTSTKRKGARSRAEIPASVLRRLNAGEIETASLAESLAVNYGLLLSRVVKLDSDSKKLFHPSVPITKRMLYGGEVLFAKKGLKILDRLHREPSDTLRGIAPFVVRAAPSLPIKSRLALVKPFADDSHFGVRECAWLALRDQIIEELPLSLKQLTHWTSARSENLRRFASESTRPRGVWCRHCRELIATPELGLPVLEPLRADASRYVQLSVGNWLNDAAKTKPAWVKSICRRWHKESPTRETSLIIKRGSRNL